MIRENHRVNTTNQKQQNRDNKTEITKKPGTCQMVPGFAFACIPGCYSRLFILGLFSLIHIFD